MKLFARVTVFLRGKQRVVAADFDLRLFMSNFAHGAALLLVRLLGSDFAVALVGQYITLEGVNGLVRQIGPSRRPPRIFVDAFQDQVALRHLFFGFTVEH